MTHPVVQQLQVFGVREAQGDVRGAAGVHARPDGSPQKGPQQLQRPVLGEETQDPDGVEDLAVSVQQVHRRHLQVAAISTSRRRSAAPLQVHLQQSVKQALLVGGVPGGRRPRAVGLSGAEVSQLVHQDVQRLVVLLQLPVERRPLQQQLLALLHFT